MAHPSGVYNSVIFCVCASWTPTEVPSVVHFSHLNAWCSLVKYHYHLLNVEIVTCSLVLYRPLEPVLALGNSRFSNDREARTL